MNYGYCSVYVIGALNASTVKIGIAASVGRRLRQIQHASADDLAILYSRTFTKRQIAAQVEARAHEILKDCRLRGEWFAVGKSEAEAAIEEAATWVRGRRLQVLDLRVRRSVHLRRAKA